MEIVLAMALFFLKYNLQPLYWLTSSSIIRILLSSARPFLSNESSESVENVLVNLSGVETDTLRDGVMEIEGTS